MSTSTGKRVKTEDTGPSGDDMDIHQGSSGPADEEVSSDGGESETTSESVSSISEGGRLGRGSTEEIHRHGGVPENGVPASIDSFPGLNSTNYLWPTKPKLWNKSRNWAMLEVGDPRGPTTLAIVAASTQPKGARQWIARDENGRLHTDATNVRIKRVATPMELVVTPDPLHSLKTVAPYSCGAAKNTTVLVDVEWEFNNKIYTGLVSRSELRKVCKPSLDQRSRQRYNATARDYESKAISKANPIKETLAALGTLEAAYEYQRKMGSSNWDVDLWIYTIKYYQDKNFFSAYGMEYIKYDAPSLWMTEKLKDISGDPEAFRQNRQASLLQQYEDKPAPQQQPLTGIGAAPAKIEDLLRQLVTGFDRQTKLLEQVRSNTVPPEEAS